MMIAGAVRADEGKTEVGVHGRRDPGEERLLRGKGGSEAKGLKVDIKDN
jgi:hypothetical protein